MKCSAVQNYIDMWIMTFIYILHYDHYWYSNLHNTYLIHQVQQKMSSMNFNLICSRKKSLSSPLGQLVSIVLEFCSENL